MTLIPILFFGVALLPLTVVTALHGFTALSLGTAALWLLSLPVLKALDTRVTHLYVVLCIGLIVFITFSGVPFPLMLMAMAAALAGWDAALAAALFSGPTSVASGAGIRRAVPVILYVAGAGALVLVIRLATIPIGFGAGIFLAVGGLALASLILRTLKQGSPARKDEDMPASSGGPEQP